MQTPQRKPRVFLSHSKKDIAFIRRLYVDLRAAQCEVWIDEVEIRHGKPWLEEIFTSGIPSCEVVLCYITENSLGSKMVQREIDARVVERLANDRVTLLLYAESSDVRSRLRSDLQTLQVPELNATNYSDLLPRIVAEIWRSYMESAIVHATQAEKVKRLELEIENRSLRDSTEGQIFSPQENAEFSNIWRLLDRSFSSTITVVGQSPLTSPNEKNVLAQKQCEISFARLIRKGFENARIKPSRNTFLYLVGDDLLSDLAISDKLVNTQADPWIQYDSEFLRYGFLARSPLPPTPSSERLFTMMGDRHELIFTEKLDRFLFWVDTKYPALSKDSVLISVR